MKPAEAHCATVVFVNVIVAVAVTMLGTVREPEPKGSVPFAEAYRAAVELQAAAHADRALSYADWNCVFEMIAWEGWGTGEAGLQGVRMDAGIGHGLDREWNFGIAKRLVRDGFD